MKKIMTKIPIEVTIESFVQGSSHLEHNKIYSIKYEKKSSNKIIKESKKNKLCLDYYQSLSINPPLRNSKTVEKISKKIKKSP